MDNPSPPLHDPMTLRASMTRRLHRRSVASGEIRLPAVPSMIDEYVTMCDKVFAALGVTFSPDELTHLRSVLQGELSEAFAKSSRSEIVVSYESPIGSRLNYRVRPQWQSIENTYDNWVATRKPPLFGTEPDARVWALADEAADPAGCPVLDIGAGTGRNSLALARRGHPVDAVEMTPKFAEDIRTQAAQSGLGVRVVELDMLAAGDDLRTDYRLIVLSEVVSDFRSTRQLRGVFELAADRLAPGGQLVFNAFVPRAGYVPDDAARELGQQVYTAIFTRGELDEAAAGLPLQLIADDSVHDYEQEHLPAGAWPQTGWYPDWVDGLDLFDVSRQAAPIEMRWLVYRRV